MVNHVAAAKSIVADAIQIPSLPERLAFVKEACGDDHELHELVSGILDAVGETVGVDERALSEGAPDCDVTRAVLETQPAVSRDDSQPSASVVEFPKIDGYQVLERIGRGGMGVVYKAKQLNLKRMVALKMIRDDDLDDDDLRRFRSEAEAIARLQHPNIVQIHEVGEHNGRPYLALELVEGGTLSEYQKEQRPSQREAAEIVEVVAHAMHYAHQRGVVHRDLKPSNILVATHQPPRSKSGRPSNDGSSSQVKTPSSQVTVRSSGGAIPKITDFGLAKQLDVDSELTRTGAVLGTPSYMAPEQAAGSQDVGTSADVYALGGILYVLLTNEPPFHGTSMMETILKVRDEEPQRLRKIDSRIDPDLETICLKCLEKDAAHRYLDAELLAEDLRRFLNGEAIQAVAPRFTYRIKKYCRRHRGGVIGIMATIALLLAFAISGISYRGTARDRQQEYDRLADAKSLVELRAAYQDLPEVEYRARREAMERWLQKAQELVGKLGQYQTVQSSIRQQGSRTTSDPGTDPTNEELAWQFDEPGLQRRHDELGRLIGEIEALLEADSIKADVENWLERTPSGEQFDRAWQEALTSIETDLQLKFQIQEGLFPIGQDPHTGLWEFVDLRTGQVPKRDAGGRLLVLEDTGIVYTLVPGDSFQMGSPPDEPGRKTEELLHPVYVSPFLFSKYEVTQAQWVRVMGQNPSQTISPVHPVDSVSWLDCVKLCETMGVRLPTEAQWEYAARARSEGMYNRDEPLDAFGWYNENSEFSTHRVGEKLPNAFGLFDVHGNVLEWCQDAYAEDFYSRLEATGRNPVNLEDTGEHDMPRVLRGGSFEGQATYLRCADRYHEKQNMRWRGFGLRPALNIE